MICCVNSSYNNVGIYTGNKRLNPQPLRWKRRNQLRPASKPALAVFVLTLLCLSLFSWFPLLLGRVQHSYNSTTTPGSRSAALVSSDFFRSTVHSLKVAEKKIVQMLREVKNPALLWEVPWPAPTSHITVGFSAQPGLSVSLGKAGQHGWAAEHSAQWDMLCGFLGTGRETVALLCQASLYCRGPFGWSSPGHSKGWKGISLSNWKDAILNSRNASI